MVTLKELKKAINDVVKAEFSTIDIHANDVEEGFERPSFFTDFDFTYRRDYSGCFMREATVIIYYFPTNRNEYKLEVLEVQDKLENAIRKGFAVGGRHLHIMDDIESEVIDKVLQVSFELEYYDDTGEASETLPKMEELEYNGN
jgi:hypothetical protein